MKQYYPKIDPKRTSIIVAECNVQTIPLYLRPLGRHQVNRCRRSHHLSFDSLLCLQPLVLLVIEKNQPNSAGSTARPFILPSEIMVKRPVEPHRKVPAIDHDDG